MRNDMANDTSVPAALFGFWWLLSTVGRIVGLNDYSWWWLMAPLLLVVGILGIALLIIAWQKVAS